MSVSRDKTRGDCLSFLAPVTETLGQPFPGLRYVQEHDAVAFLTSLLREQPVLAALCRARFGIQSLGPLIHEIITRVHRREFGRELEGP